MSGLEQMKYVLWFGLFVLFSYALQKLAAWLGRQEGAPTQVAGKQPSKAEAREQEPRRRKEREPRRPSRVSPEGPLGRPLVPLEKPHTVERRIPVRAMLTGRDSLRRAVVMGVVLGPCRAEEPG